MDGSSRRHGSTATARSSVLCLLLTVVCSVLWSAQPALAHTSLVSSSPGSSAVVAGPLEVVTLVFSQPVSTDLAQVVVTGPDGADVAEGPVEVSGGTVTRAVGAWPTSGGYRLAYRVLAQDGHPITGEVPFEVTLPATPGATPASVPPAAADGSAGAPTAAARPAGTGVALPLLGALGLGGLVLVVGAVRAGRRAQVVR